jgi:hypothetical protein
VTVNATPGTPSVTDATTSVGQQTASGLVISRAVADDGNVTHFKITNITAGTLFLNDGVTLVEDGDFITAAEGAAGLKYTPTGADDGSFEVQASTSGDDSGLGGGTAVATIDVRSFNASTIGLFDPSASTFYLRNSNSAGPANTAVQYGAAPATWRPITGDWDGDGINTVALYDPTTSTFFLRNSNTPGPGDVTAQYGSPGAGWLPIAGDWDGDGDTTVGMFDPATNSFYLKNSNTPGPADVTVQYGAAGNGWSPIVGDWDGDGTTTVGLYDILSSTFYLRDSNTPGHADDVFNFGLAGAARRALAGDWNADGVVSIALFDPQTNVFYLRNSNTAGAADTTFRYGNAGNGFLPVSGRWTSVAPASLTSQVATPAVALLAPSAPPLPVSNSTEPHDSINQSSTGGQKPTIDAVLEPEKEQGGESEFGDQRPDEPLDPIDSALGDYLAVPLPH